MTEEFGSACGGAAARVQEIDFVVPSPVGERGVLISLQRWSKNKEDVKKVN